MSREYNKTIFSFTTCTPKRGVNHVDLPRNCIDSPLGLLFTKYQAIIVCMYVLVIYTRIKIKIYKYTKIQK